MLENIRYSLRQFVEAPGFTITAILTLALGIGATTAIFTLVHAVLLKSLPVRRPSELIRVGNNENCCINGGMEDDWSLFSTEQYREFRDHTPGFVSLAAFQAGRSQIGVRRAGSNRPSEPFGADSSPATRLIPSGSAHGRAVYWSPLTIRRVRPQSPSSAIALGGRNSIRTLRWSAPRSLSTARPSL